MYQRICCPIDGSETSRRGLDEAIRLSVDQGAQLYLLHVVDNSALTTYTPLVETLFQEGRDAGNAILAAARDAAEAQGVEAQTDLVEILAGRVGPTIAETAAALNADLIVMGTHGRRALGRLLMGSDAIAVIGNAAVPVLLVK